jgi:hypothetical protein
VWEALRRSGNACGRAPPNHGRFLWTRGDILVNDHEHTYAEYAARKAGTATSPTAELANEMLRERGDYLPLMTWELYNSSEGSALACGVHTLEMVHGRAPQILSPSRMSLDGFKKNRPRARKDMESLSHYLDTMRKETDITCPSSRASRGSQAPDPLRSGRSSIFK